MKTLVIYDSQYGNTQKVAQMIAETVKDQAQPVKEVNPADLQHYDLLIIGSPTHGGWYTEGIKELLQNSAALKGTKVAVFDTRTKKSIFGFAAPRMARRLEKIGAHLAASPEGFIVLGIEGPLMEGELERASGWVRTLVA